MAICILKIEKIVYNSHFYNVQRFRGGVFRSSAGGFGAAS